MGVSAATLTQTTSNTPGSGFGVGDSGDQVGAGDDTDAGVDLGPDESQETQVSLGLCVRFFRSPEFLAGAAVVLVLGFAGLYRSTRSWLLSSMTLFSLSMPFAMVVVLLAACGQGPSEVAIGAGEAALNESAFIASEGGGSPGAGGEETNLTTPSSLLGIVLALAIVGSVGLLVFSTGDDEDELADEPPEPPEPARQRGVAQAARVAADRLEADAEVENAVYRAWREMTVHLDVDEPRSSTPAEFAAAAVDAGMDREDVAALTELFENARYGGQEPTEADERRAIEALRNIEETYGEEFDTPELRGDES